MRSITSTRRMITIIRMIAKITMRPVVTNGQTP
jgi:hypothetical protein